jgi:hypothetical protein
LPVRAIENGPNGPAGGTDVDVGGGGAVALGTGGGADGVAASLDSSEPAKPITASTSGTISAASTQPKPGGLR